MEVINGRAMKLLEKFTPYRLHREKKSIDVLYEMMYTPGYDIYEDVELMSFKDIFPEECIKALVEYGPETARQLIRLPFKEIRKVSGCTRKQLAELMEAIIEEFKEERI